MKILVLEDEDAKFYEISSYVTEVVPDAEIDRVKNWLDYSRAVSSTKFDLILLDLLVPKSGRDPKIENHCTLLVETTRDYQSKSFTTPAIVLTRHNMDEGDFLNDLNLVDINVISFNDHGAWREAVKIKLLSSKPKKKFDVVIVCALEKEADAFKDLTSSWSGVKTISGLLCIEAQIDQYKLVIVRAKRMGLVSAAIAASCALERFEPRLICMSGICGGVKDESQIYDLLVTQTCHQHDAGKWSATGFKSQHYDVQLEGEVENKIIEIASTDAIKYRLLEDVRTGRSELPVDQEFVTYRIKPDVPTSSGSAVLAEDGKVSELAVGQRKLAGFDMEVYSIYEAAKNAQKRTAFFAAKTVVDDGGVNKGDSFHRIGCLLSAKFVVEAIRAGVADVWGDQ